MPEHTTFPDQDVPVELLVGGDDGAGGRLDGRVYAVDHAAETLRVALEPDQYTAHLQPTVLVTLLYESPLGPSQTRWRIDEYLSRVSKSATQLDIVLTLSPESNEPAVQRRRFFRLPAHRPVRCQKVTIPSMFESDPWFRSRQLAEWARSMDDKSPYGVTVNVGAGGVAFECGNEEFKKDDRVYVEVELSDGEYIKAAGKVVRVITRDRRSGMVERPVIAVQYLGLSPEDERIIMRFSYRAMQEKAIKTR